MKERQSGKLRHVTRTVYSARGKGENKRNDMRRKLGKKKRVVIKKPMKG